MRYVLGSLALLASLAFVPLRPKPPSDPIREWNLKTEEAPLSRVETFPVPGRPDLVVAICDYCREWWGFFGVYQISDGAVQWQAQLEIEPDEQSIHRVRALQLQGFSNPVIEVLGITHRGNGNLYLYELRGQKLVLLFETRAVDFHDDGFMFKGGCLTTDYRDLNGDGIVDIILEGTVEERGEKGEELIGSEPYRQVFIWDSRLQEFSEDISSRVGVAEYYD